MGETDITPKFLGIGLTGSHLVTLVGDPRLTARLDESGATVVVAGIERIDGSEPGDPALESTVATTFLAERAPRTAFLAAAVPDRDHPYNLARRVASLDHLSRGRSGLVLGVRDGHAPPGGPAAWRRAEGATAGVELTRDAAIAIEKLWQSWPYESIVADRRSRIFARADQIVHIDHEGIFDIAGPLTVPSTAHGSPVLAWYADSGAALAAAAGVVDLVILPADDRADGPADGPADGKAGDTADGRDRALAAAAEVLRSAPSRFAGGAGRTLLFAQLAYHRGHGIDAFVAQAESVLAHPDVDGILVRPDAPAEAAAEVIEGVVPRLVARGLVRTQGQDTLRARLALPRPAPLLAGARPAFAAPEPQPPLQPAAAGLSQVL
ncbi:LLM class flavin-dependent oxidoreductase [Nonomuraea zeae]|uniref:LLM class flavin-dependent oxidoreductase n=1 Tax=Nonomuraea zeae TaxID=1642303 RepID=A0A5S4FUN0_9ACTN|nr:LLM class flavin-dependent oxidoreductase [Nonomuraea zeae]TMR24477.1 LLM class flavin-dependent oxidoreductase [Nonomuraea zeae]